MIRGANLHEAGGTEFTFKDEFGKVSRIELFHSLTSDFVGEVRSTNVYLVKQHAVIQTAVEFAEENSGSPLPGDASDKEVVEEGQVDKGNTNTKEVAIKTVLTQKQLKENAFYSVLKGGGMKYALYYIY